MYHRQLASSLRPVTSAMQKVREEADKPKKGWKWKTKGEPSEPDKTPKKKKWATRRKRRPTPSDEENVVSSIIYGVCIPEQV